MKILTIGRGENCHIVFDNPLISRQHAILKIYPTGKMEIKDQSTNGTSINGTPIRKDKPYKVTRKDVITFAGVSQLDWKQVPNPLKPYIIGGICIVALLFAWGAYPLISGMIGNGDSGYTGEKIPIVQTDSTMDYNPFIKSEQLSTEDVGKKVEEAKRKYERDQKKKQEAMRKKAEQTEKKIIEQAKRDSAAAEEDRKKKEAEQNQKPESKDSVQMTLM